MSLGQASDESGYGARGLAAQRAVEGSEAVGPSEPLGCTEGQRVNLMTL